MAIGLTLKFEIKPGTSEPVRGGLLARPAAVVKAQDEGCEMYDLFKSIDFTDEPSLMVERWTTAALSSTRT
jgi:quinol monooxygenase YgiN